MEWEDKVTLITLGNQKGRGLLEKKTFQDFVLSKIEIFDGQAWDMFSNIVDIIPTEIKSDSEFWMKVYNKLKSIDCNDPKFGLRSGMRIALIQTICEDLEHANAT